LKYIYVFQIILLKYISKHTIRKVTELYIVELNLQNGKDRLTKITTITTLQLKWHHHQPTSIPTITSDLNNLPP